MKPRKFHISPWLLLGFAVLLLVGCLMAAVGPAFARYRAQTTGNITIQPESRACVYLGCMVDGIFRQQQSGWTEVDGRRELSFAISNGISATDFIAQDQQASLRILVSLGAWSAGNPANLSLSVDGQTYTAVAERIAEGSALQTQFGDGWVLRFRNASGEELTWNLSGQEWNCISMLLSMDATAIADTSLLQLQVVAEFR